ncbi:molybdopterin cofactor-binding domain-containing protein [Saccharopolyspora sp. NPDC049426]|uniref:xanthine dehydrogenase family protein molybdopterin-binding subunit n=1 Tax=Saccharopolyspora sp. NPDC049426 TaxID=3155652 RepID=UPI003425CCAF
MVTPATPEETAEGAAVAEPGQASGVGRRRFLTYLMAAPTLTVAAQLVPEGEVAAAAAKSQIPVPLPPLEPMVDFADAVTMLAMPTMPLMRLEIAANNKVRFEMPRLEVGQGINTSVVMMIAEEMDAKPSDVVVEISDARPELFINHFTGFSSGVRALWQPLASMAAAARSRLVTAAGKRFGVPATDLTVSDTAVHAPDGRKLSFGELAKDAAKVTLPAVPARPKKIEQHKVLGKPMNRVDARGMVTGATKYVGDIKIPGSVVAVVVRPPTVDGKVAAFDDSSVRALPGVSDVVELPTGVAVCAENTWQALEAAKKLHVSWVPGPGARTSDTDIKATLNEKTGSMMDTLDLGDGEGKIDASFDFAGVSHSPMEVSYAVADVRRDRAEVWYPGQVGMGVQVDVAKAVGLPQPAVTAHITRAGGSFGARGFNDAVVEAARVSKAVGKPVKLMWTRNDETRHGRMRPPTHHRIIASYRGGKVRSFQQKMSGVMVDLSHGAGIVLTSEIFSAINKPVDEIVFYISQNVPYEFGLVTIDGKGERIPGVKTAEWRGVHGGSFRAAQELIVDELAAKLGKDPLKFRMDSLKTDRAKAVLKKVGVEGGWGRPMPQGWAQGLAVHEEHRSSSACLVEINATDPENPRVTKAFVAVDVGRAINPRGVEAQMQGGLIDGISTILQAGLHFDNGAVREGSFSDFKWARQRHSPLETKVFVMPPTGDPGGVGELGVPVCAGAVATAYARATGTQPRSFPINF